MPDIPGDTATSASIRVGGTVTGSLEVVGDHDWYQINLTAGQSITISLQGSGVNPLEDPYLYLRSSSGVVIKQDDDGGAGRDSMLHFTATTSGTYYIDAGAWSDGYAGGFTLSVDPYTPPVLTVFTNDQIADQLVDGYWESEGGSSRHFNVSQGGTITVNLSALTAAGQSLARDALDLWSDVIGVDFREVATGGQIVFDDDEDGAFSTSVTSGGFITSSEVNISTQWLANYGTGLNSYSFQSYVHEIGHALGLGHAGDYNGEASFPDDALYLNDSWATTVMSYFSQTDNTYFASQYFNADYAVTPMSADIVAMARLYGLSTTTRTGDTTYGFNSNAGREVFDAEALGSIRDFVAYTVFDSGGTDTLDYSGYDGSLINLNPETFSNIGGQTGNVSIARGTIIENAIGGSGSDFIIGNAADNLLDSGGGYPDTVSYAAATAGVTVSLATTGPQATGGAGIDTLIDFDNLIGSAFDDTLTGVGLGTVSAGAGDDLLIGSRDGGNLNGEAGNDLFLPSTGYNVIDGGSGWDVADFSRWTSGVRADLGTGASDARLTSIEELVGSNYADILTGTASAEVFRGNGGNDTIEGSGGDDYLYGNGGNDRLGGGSGYDRLYGGSGDDDYIVRDDSDFAYEDAGEGYDTVVSSVSLTLRDNLERLTLGGDGDLDGKGNDLANRIDGNDGDNTLDGLAGDDRLYAGDGNDRLIGGEGYDRMYGGVGDDRYVVADATDYAYENAGEGYDRVESSIGLTLRDNLEMLSLTGTANLTAKGNALDNTMLGNDGINRLYGLDGDDRLDGHAGNDRLDGGAGADRMYGNSGDDLYYVDSSDDAAVEQAGEGTDTVYASVDYALRANVEKLVLTGTADLLGRGSDGDDGVTGNAGANKLYGYDGDDRIDGGNGDDFVDAGSGNDLLIGGGGADHLYGRDGADVLQGGGGDDWVEGGAGRDRAYGGDGADDFVFRSDDFAGLTTSSCDQIHDFSQSDGDTLRLNLADANATIAGDQAFAFIGSDAFSGTAGELRTEQISGNTYVQGDIDGDGSADLMIRLDGLHDLGTSDFIF